MKYLILITLFLPFKLNAENIEQIDSEQMDNTIEALEILTGKKEVEGIEIIVIEKEKHELHALEQQIIEKEQKAYLEHLRYMEQHKTESQLIKERVKAIKMEQHKADKQSIRSRSKTLEANDD